MATINTALTIFLDIVNNKLVTSLTNPAQFVFPPLFYGEVFPVNLVPVSPIVGSSSILPGGTALYSTFIQANNSLSLNVGIGIIDGSYTEYFEAIAGGTGDQAQWVWTADTTGSVTGVAGAGYFAGRISLYTSNFQTVMNGKSSLQPVLQFAIADSANTVSVTGSNYIVEYSGGIVVNQPVLAPGGSPAPSGPLAQFYTKAELNALFVRFAGNANGSTISLPSPSGTHTRIIGIADDGSPIEDTQ